MCGAQGGDHGLRVASEGSDHLDAASRRRSRSRPGGRWWGSRRRPAGTFRRRRRCPGAPVVGADRSRPGRGQRVDQLPARRRRGTNTTSLSSDSSGCGVQRPGRARPSRSASASDTPGSATSALVCATKWATPARIMRWTSAPFGSVDAHRVHRCEQQRVVREQQLRVDSTASATVVGHGVDGEQHAADRLGGVAAARARRRPTTRPSGGRTTRPGLRSGRQPDHAGEPTVCRGSARRPCVRWQRVYRDEEASAPWCCSTGWPA